MNEPNLNQGQPAPRPRLAPVTQYHLSGDGMQITYHSGTPDVARLQYNGKTYQGRALFHETTMSGHVVSVILENVPDLHTTSLSLTLPQANCPSTMRSTSIHTFAVITTGRTSIGGPALVSGQIQSYKLVPLTGNAW